MGEKTNIFKNNLALVAVILSLATGSVASVALSKLTVQSTIKNYISGIAAANWGTFLLAVLFAFVTKARRAVFSNFYVTISAYAALGALHLGLGLGLSKELSKGGLIEYEQVKNSAILSITVGAVFLGVAVLSVFKPGKKLRLSLNF